MSSRLFLAAFAVGSLARPAVGQMAYDGTLSAGALSGPDYVIRQEHGTTRGANLFHSFRDFHVNAGETATFTGAGVSNVIARVTGGQRSNIDGAIVSQIGGANLFLMNPDGFLFGSGASVDVSGAFVATTADYLELADGQRFTAAPGATDALLTTAPPAAFGFLRATPAAVTLASAFLFTQPGRSIHIVAGDVNAEDATIDAPTGRVSLISLASPGRVALEVTDAAALPAFSGFTAKGTIALQRSSITASDRFDAQTGGGRIVIRGGRLEAVQSTVSADSAFAAAGRGIDLAIDGHVSLRNNTQISTVTTGSARGGNVSLRAGSVDIDRAEGQVDTGLLALSLGSGRAGDVTVRSTLKFRLGAGSEVASNTGGAGAGGTVRVEAGELEVAGDGVEAARIEAVTTSAGLAGSVEVVVDGAMQLRTGGIVRSSTFGTGDGGGVAVQAGSLTVDGGGRRIATGILAQSNPPPGVGAPSASAGDAGEVRVEIGGRIALFAGGRISTSTNTSGDGGAMEVRAGELLVDGRGAPFATGLTGESLLAVGGGDGRDLRIVIAGRATLLDGGAISSTTFGDGDGGGIFLRAGEFLADGRGSTSFTGVTALTQKIGAGGKGGPIEVAIAGPLTLRDGALIDSSTFSTGIGGAVRVEAGSITIDRAGSRLFTGIGSDTDQGGGRGGSVTATAGAITLRNGGLISTSTFGPGDAGNIVVVTADFSSAGAGAFTPFVPTGASGLSASVRAGASGQGGAIRLLAGRIVLSEAAQVSASTDGSGDGGDIVVQAAAVSLRSGAAITTAASAAGLAGSIDLAISGPLRLAGASRVASTSERSDAGQIAVLACGGVRLDDSALTVQARAGDAGQISVATPGGVNLRRSGIIAEAGGSGGNITIAAAGLTLDSSRITANAVAGDGGLITLNLPATGVLGDPSDFIVVSEVVRQSADSRISASSQEGVQGALRISAPEVDLSNSLEALSAALLDAAAQLREQCARRLNADFSSFLILGRGGMEETPEDAQSGGAVPHEKTDRENNPAE